MEFFLFIFNQWFTIFTNSQIKHLNKQSDISHKIILDSQFFFPFPPFPLCPLVPSFHHSFLLSSLISFFTSFNKDLRCMQHLTGAWGFKIEQRSPCPQETYSQ